MRTAYATMNSKLRAISHDVQIMMPSACRCPRIETDPAVIRARLDRHATEHGLPIPCEVCGDPALDDDDVCASCLADERPSVQASAAAALLRIADAGPLPGTVEMERLTRVVLGIDDPEEV